MSPRYLKITLFKYFGLFLSEHLPSVPAVTSSSAIVRDATSNLKRKIMEEILHIYSHCMYVDVQLLLCVHLMY